MILVNEGNESHQIGECFATKHKDGSISINVLEFETGKTTTIYKFPVPKCNCPYSSQDDCPAHNQQ